MPPAAVRYKHNSKGLKGLLINCSRGVLPVLFKKQLMRCTATTVITAADEVYCLFSLTSRDILPAVSQQQLKRTACTMQNQLYCLQCTNSSCKLLLNHAHIAVALAILPPTRNKACCECQDVHEMSYNTQPERSSPMWNFSKAYLAT